ARDAEIDFGSTLPVRALRHLIEHAAISLDVEWRDSPDEAWEAIVRTAQGREVPARETVWMRTREVWLHAIDLDNGARMSDIPAPVLTRLLSDITGAWRARGTDAGIVVAVEGTDDCLGGAGVADGDPADAGDPDGTVVSGSLPDLVRWASGRGDAGVRTSTGEPVTAPRWI
ncbi:maleylpyruvate isomerase, partial [Burkholderia multivorans]|uniref:maleylpyruvate isomerase family mycothiol-dependent enzyme n=1 Tax=Burkholderia multivorans TaxID=87883 RepID=UPI000DAC0888